MVKSSWCKWSFKMSTCQKRMCEKDICHIQASLGAIGRFWIIFSLTSNLYVLTVTIIFLLKLKSYKKWNEMNKITDKITCSQGLIIWMLYFIQYVGLKLRNISPEVNLCSSEVNLCLLQRYICKNINCIIDYKNTQK